ncbi:MAG: hypothetical protein CM15mP129_01670 [Chloroflexota bacterium]|nr:MAG: hypothetical protein CM15mP129_01670 [Chloroflexota bacterium]
MIEVVLGIYKPAILNEYFLNLKLLNWIFIILTIVKAYYITWDFMHMRDETSILRRVVVWTAVFLILYPDFYLNSRGVISLMSLMIHQIISKRLLIFIVINKFYRKWVVLGILFITSSFYFSCIHQLTITIHLILCKKISMS